MADARLDVVFELNSKLDGINKAVDRMERAKKTSRGLTGVLSKIGPTILAAFGTAAVLGAVRGFTRAVKEGADRVDDLAKNASKLGVTTENLQAIRLQAELTGTSIQSIDKAILTLNKNAGGVTSGLFTASSTQTKAFEALEISIEEINSLDTGELFERTITQLGNVENQSRQTALAMTLLGRGGAEALNLVKGGANGLAEARQDIEDLGLSISSFDASKVEEANDNMLRLGLIASGTKDRIAIELSPAITALTENLLDAAKAGGGVGEGIASGVEKSVVALDKIRSVMTLVSSSFKISTNLTTLYLFKIAEGANFVALKTSEALGSVTGFLAESFAPAFDAAKQSSINDLNLLLEGSETILNNLIQGAGSAATKIGEVINSIISKVTEGIEAKINAGIQGVNKLIDAANSVSPVEIAKVSEVAIKAPSVDLSTGIEKVTFARFKSNGEKSAEAFFDGISDANDLYTQNLKSSKEILSFSSDALVQNIKDAGGDAKNAFEDLTKGSEFLKKYREERAKTAELVDGGAEGSVAANGLSALSGIVPTVSKAGGGGGGAAGASGSVSNGEFAAIQKEFLPPEQAILEEYARKREVILAQDGITEMARTELLQDITQQREDSLLQIERQRTESKLQNASQFFGDLSTLTQSGNKKLFLIGKAAAVADATIQGVLGVQRALASAPPPINFALAAAVGVASAVNIANIVSQPMPGFFTGGFIGGENAAPARYDDTPIMAARGEFVVNNRDAGRNASLLKAINAGRNPSDILNLPSRQLSLPSFGGESGGRREQTTSDRSSSTTNFFMNPSDLLDAQEADLEGRVINILKNNSTQFGI